MPDRHLATDPTFLFFRRNQAKGQQPPANEEISLCLILFSHHIIERIGGQVSVGGIVYSGPWCRVVTCKLKDPVLVPADKGLEESLC